MSMNKLANAYAALNDYRQVVALHGHSLHGEDLVLYNRMMGADHPPTLL